MKTSKKSVGLNFQTSFKLYVNSLYNCYLFYVDVFYQFVIIFGQDIIRVSLLLNVVYTRC